MPQAIYDAYQKVLPKRKLQIFADDLITEIESATTPGEMQGTIDFNVEETEEGGDK